MMRHVLVLLLAVFSASLLSSSLWAQELYRYRDANGITRMEPSIPAEYVDKGYEVLNSQGMLIERVPPRQLSSESDQLDEARRTDDQILLASYSAVPEIEAHRNRRLTGIQSQIDIITSDRRVLNTELDREIRIASGYRADGREVPQDISRRITELDRLISTLDQRLEQREREKQEIDQEFAAKIVRFRELKPDA